MAVDSSDFILLISLFLDALDTNQVMSSGTLISQKIKTPPNRSEKTFHRFTLLQIYVSNGFSTIFKTASFQIECTRQLRKKNANQTYVWCNCTRPIHINRVFGIVHLDFFPLSRLDHSLFDWLNKCIRIRFEMCKKKGKKKQKQNMLVNILIGITAIKCVRRESFYCHFIHRRQQRQQPKRFIWNIWTNLHSRIVCCCVCFVFLQMWENAECVRLEI